MLIAVMPWLAVKEGVTMLAGAYGTESIVGTGPTVGY